VEVETQIPDSTTITSAGQEGRSADISKQRQLEKEPQYDLRKKKGEVKRGSVLSRGRKKQGIANAISASGAQRGRKSWIIHSERN